MLLTQLTLRNFRCFERLELEIPPAMVIVGANAAGKSTLLDAIRCLLTGADAEGVSYTWDHVVTERLKLDALFSALREPNARGPKREDVSVEGRFSDFSDEERAAWGSYLSDGELVVAARLPIHAAERELGVVLDARGLARLRELDGRSTDTWDAEFLEYLRSEYDVTVLRWPGPDGPHWFLGGEGVGALLEPTADLARLFADERVVAFPGPDRMPPSIGTILRPAVLHQIYRRLQEGGPEAAAALDAINNWIAAEPLMTSWAEKAIAEVAGGYARVLPRYLPDFKDAEFGNEPHSDSPRQFIERAIGDIVVGLKANESAVGVDPSTLGAGARRAATLAALELFSDASMWDPSDWVVLLVEEPEVGLHPAAQRRVARNLAALPTYGVQTVVVTHSAAVVAANSLDRVRVARVRMGNDASSDTPTHDILRATGTAELAELLGSTPSDALLPDLFVVVEGDSDAAVFEAWAHRLGFSFANTGMRLMPAHGSGGMEVVVRTLSGAYPGGRIVAILDNGSDTMKQKLVIERRFGERVRLHLLSRTEIEGYFSLRAVASWLEMHGAASPITDEVLPFAKKRLQRLADRHLSRPYDVVSDGLAIAGLMKESEIDPEIRKLLIDLRGYADGHEPNWPPT